MENKPDGGKVRPALLLIVCLCVAAVVVIGLLLRSNGPEDGEPEASSSYGTIAPEEEPAQTPDQTEPAQGEAGDTEEPEDTDPTQTEEEPVPPEVQEELDKASPEPFYGLWCVRSEDGVVALAMADSLRRQGYDAAVYRSTDWEGLTGQLQYMVTAGVYPTQAEAEAALPGVREMYEDAYVRYSGDWIGQPDQ